MPRQILRTPRHSPKPDFGFARPPEIKTHIAVTVAILGHVPELNKRHDPTTYALMKTGSVKNLVPRIGAMPCFIHCHRRNRNFGFRFHAVPIARKRDGIEQHHIFADMIWPMNFSFAHPKTELALADAEHGGLARAERKGIDTIAEAWHGTVPIFAFERCQCFKLFGL